MADKTLLDYLKILPRRMQQVPAWRDLAQATTTVLNEKVDDYRNSLAKIRDSSRNRVGDEIHGISYVPRFAGDLPKDETGTFVPLAPHTRINHAIIKKIYINNAGQNLQPAPDAAEIEFKIADGRTLTWIMPFTDPQERSLLIQNSQMLGFDFFSSTFTDEDYKRLYDFIAMYWPEGGRHNFLRFISWVKGIRLDMAMLWSQDNDTNEFPFLEPQQPDFIPAYLGGDHYQTSHVELYFYPREIENIENFDLNDLRNLFYYMAPIHLVMERITGVIQHDFDIFVGLSIQENTIFQARWAYESEPGTASHNIGWAVQSNVIEQFRDWYKPLPLRSEIVFSPIAQETTILTDRDEYIAPWLKLNITLAAQFQETNITTGMIEYQIPLMRGELTQASIFQQIDVLTGHDTYVQQPLRMTMEAQIASQAIVIYQWADTYKISNKYIDVISPFIWQETNIFFSKRMIDQIPFPEIVLNSFDTFSLFQQSNIILGTTWGFDNSYILISPMSTAQSCVFWTGKIAVQG